jgi:uncharacterized protein (TIGR03435 family)
MCSDISAQDSELSFEVASIRPSPRDAVSAMAPLPGGRFVATNTTLSTLVQVAYRISNRGLKGGPAWMYEDNFDLSAQAGRSISSTELSLMMQTLLADRFKLVVHRESNLVSGYALIPGKKGPKLEKAEEALGKKYGINAFGNRWTSEASMNQLAFAISTVLRVPVVNKTGLEGYYKISLLFQPQTPQAEPRGVDTPPDIFTAIEEQLGLKLEPSKEAVETIVVDHAEHPSAN